MTKICATLRRAALTAFAALLLLSLAGCKKRVGLTAVCVEDSVRHYYPVIAGQELDLQYRLANIGKEPLVIKDIQPSCGCISVDKDRNNIVPPGKEITLHFRYNSLMNTGYVRQMVRLFGNFYPKGMAVLVFDVNVAPKENDPWYYEQMKDEEDRDKRLEGLVDGDESEKGYYVDIDRDSRAHTKYPWRKESEDE